MQLSKSYTAIETVNKLQKQNTDLQYENQELKRENRKLKNYIRGGVYGKILTFLIIGFMISATINVALLTVIYIIWKGLNKNTTFCFGRQCSVCYNICGNTHFCMFTSYFYYTHFSLYCQIRFFQKFLHLFEF